MQQARQTKTHPPPPARPPVRTMQVLLVSAAAAAAASSAAAPSVVRAADPVPPGVHESRMTVCGAAPSRWWFQQFDSSSDGSDAGQVVLAGDGLDGQVPGEPTMCVDVSCGRDVKGYTCGTGKMWPDNQELQYWKNDSSIRWLVGGRKGCGSSESLCLWHGEGEAHASMAPCPDKLVTDPAGQWEWGAPLTNATAKPLINTKSHMCYELLPAGVPAPSPPPVCVNGNNATGHTLCACASDDKRSTGKPNGGQLTLTCVGPAGSQGGKITAVVFASLGNPSTSGGCGHFHAGGCHDDGKAKAAVEAACVGQTACTITADIQHLNGGKDPCVGTPKHVAVEVTCDSEQPPFPPPPPPPGPPPPPLPKGMFSPCAVAGSKFSKQPWCNSSLEVGSRVSDMLTRMTTEEKLQYRPRVATMITLRNSGLAEIYA